MDRNLSLVAVKFCVMVWVLVLRKHVTIHQLLIPLLQVQPSLTIQVLLKQISVFVMVRLLLSVAVVTQIQWTMWTLFLPIFLNLVWITGLLPSLVVVLVLLTEVMQQLVHQVNSILLVCCKLLMICLLTLVSLLKVLVLRLKWLKSKLKLVQQELRHTRTGVRLTQVLIIPLKLRINTMFLLRSTLTL